MEGNPSSKAVSLSDYPYVTLTVLGSGTSVGVPSIGCDCDVCTSTDPRDNRLRASVWLNFAGKNVVIDTSPDFRTQSLRAGIPYLDAVLYTHSHADHILGLDDLRPFNYRQGGTIPIYASEPTLVVIRRVFEYVFANGHRENSVPRLTVNVLDGEPFELFGQQITPIPLYHGSLIVFGYRVGQIAYLTDHNQIPEESMDKLRDLDILFLDALRYKPHPTHSSVEQSLAIVERLKPKTAYFTHICHDLGHERAESKLPPNVFLAYDGLRVEALL